MSLEKLVISTPTKGKEKTSAIEHAIDALGLPFEVEGHGKVKSGVPEQPSSIVVGCRGAYNRTERMPNKDGQVTAVENFAGMTALENNTTLAYDIGVVVSRDLPDQSGKAKHTVALSAGIQIPVQDYLDTAALGFGKNTISAVSAARVNATGGDFKAKDPHEYYTKGACKRQDLLALPVGLTLIGDPSQGALLEDMVIQQIARSGVVLSDTYRFRCTSTQRIKTEALLKTLNLLHAANPTIDAYNGNVPDSPSQVMDMDTAFQLAYDRFGQDPSPKEPGVVTISTQSCICPVILGADTHYLELAVVIAEKIGDDGQPIYYASTSAGAEIPEIYIRTAQDIGFDKTTVGQVIANELNKSRVPDHDELATADDPEKALYGVSRKVILMEALLILFAQMQSGLETR